jgi:hypothetical protein
LVERVARLSQLRGKRQAERAKPRGLIDTKRRDPLLDLRLDQDAVDRRLEAEEILGILHRHGGQEVDVTLDLRHRERDERRYILVRRVHELVANAHFVE